MEETKKIIDSLNNPSVIFNLVKTYRTKTRNISIISHRNKILVFKPSSVKL